MLAKRSNSVHFRVSDIEKMGLHVLAKLEKRKPSEMMRELLREGLKSRELDFVSIAKMDSGNPTVVTA